MDSVDMETGGTGVALAPTLSGVERSGTERRVGANAAALAVGLAHGIGASVDRDSEIPERAKRRTYTAEYRLRILREADGCKRPGEIGALLRREGLYSSIMSFWREQRKRGELKRLSGKRPGPQAQHAEVLAGRVRELEGEKLAWLGEKTRLEGKLKRAETIIEIQKKASELLGVSLTMSERDGQG